MRRVGVRPVLVLQVRWPELPQVIHSIRVRGVGRCARRTEGSKAIRADPIELIRQRDLDDRVALEAGESECGVRAVVVKMQGLA